MKGTNKLLQMVTAGELWGMLYVEYMTPSGIAKRYKVVPNTVARALKICNIELDKEVWRGGNSYKQRQLLLSSAKLTDRQNQILVGSLLGDGSIPKVPGGSPYYSLFQRAKYRKYIEFMHQELSPFSLQVRERSTFQKDSGKIHKGYTFDTIRYPEFSKYKELFYPEGKKVVPSNTAELLSELGLSIWYLEDGHQDTSCRNSTLFTCCFTDIECQLLIGVLYKKFNVKSHLQRANGVKKQPIIFIGAREGYDTFHDIVDPFVKQFDCFSHKLKRNKKGKRIGEQVPTSRLTEDMVRYIRNRCTTSEFSVTEYSRDFNISPSTIYNVIKGHTWKHVVR